MDHTVAFHVESFRREVLEMRGMRKVHENLVVKLSQVIDGVVERYVQNFSVTHRFIQSDSDEKGGFPDAVTRNDYPYVSAAQTAVDRVLE